jgi:hypothetical protein
MLPENVNSIYVVTIQNKSYEPAVEEKLTRAIQEEFMSDGRLDVTDGKKADAVLVCTLRKFEDYTGRLGVDRLPLTNRLDLVADVALFDPLDRQREKPLMKWTNVVAEWAYISDVRYVDYRSSLSGGVEGPYQEALRALARRIVATVITQPPDKEAPGLVKGTAPRTYGPERVLGKERIDTRFLDTTSTEPKTLNNSTVRPEKP